MSVRVLDLDPARYRSHPLHGDDNAWIETNCATDMWIEILHSLGLDPVAGLAFSVATDFGGDQWTMFTYPAEDLRVLYGIQVNELNVWRPLVDHVEEQLALGCLVSFDADAFYLPDTRGITYLTAHQKTTICAQVIDRPGRRLGYFHNAGYAELGDEDFDRLFHLGEYADQVASAMPPYTDQIRLDALEPGGATVVAVVERLRTHLGRRSPGSPVQRLAARLDADLGWLATHSMEEFHRYAFGTVRHLGANGQLAAAFVRWLDERDGGGLSETAAHFDAISEGAKRLEFMLARAVNGRQVDVERAMAPMEEAWGAATDALVARYGP